MYIKTSHQDGNPCLYVGILLLAAAVMAALLAENPAASPERVEFLRVSAVCLALTGACSALLDPIFRALRALDPER